MRFVSGDRRLAAVQEPSSALRAGREPNNGGAAKRRSDTNLMAVGRFVAMFATFTAAWLMLFSVLPLIVGWSPMVVSSGSMRPVLPEGSIVHVDDSVPLETLGPGSIITFNGVRDGYTTHRVVGIERNGDTAVGFRTKGDSNQHADTTIVPIDDVVGVARMVVPFAGLPAHWLGSSRWILLAFFLVVLACAATVTVETILLFVGWGELRYPSRRAARGGSGCCFDCWYRGTRDGRRGFLRRPPLEARSP